MRVNPKYPLYIPSKGRWESRLTHKTLTGLKVPHYVVVEEQEYKKYKETLSDFATILVLDRKYQEDYDACDDFGMTKSKGPGPARNFIWDHSISQSAGWHWVMDDNISYFARLHNTQKIRVLDGTIFRCMEDFCERYENVSMAGPNYTMFAPLAYNTGNFPPFILNTRIYSCNLIRNDVPFRWRGRYNEDTDLSLQMLKAGWCTVQFYAFLQQKMGTQTMKGGNTEEFYAKEGTRFKSEMQVRLHPDVSRLIWRFRRIHHYVDYTSFKKNMLKRKKDAIPLTEKDDYGMRLVKLRGVEEDAAVDSGIGPRKEDAGKNAGGRRSKRKEIRLDTRSKGDDDSLSAGGVFVEWIGSRRIRGKKDSEEANK